MPEIGASLASAALTDVGEITLSLWLGRDIEQPEKNGLVYAGRRRSSYSLMFPFRILASIALLICSAFATIPGYAAEAPYFENFDVPPPGGVPANFVETPDSRWSVVPGTYNGFAAVDLSGGTSLSGSSINFTNVVGHNFTIKTRFAVSSFGALTTRMASVGLVILADNPDITTGGYVLRWESGGADDVHNKLFLERAGPWVGVGNVAANRIAPPKGERLFTMTLRGEYVNGSLHLTGTLATGPQKVSVEATDPAPLTGTYFGFRLSASVSASHVSSISANYDDFSVTLDP